MDSAYRDYHSMAHRDRDPLQWVHRYSSAQDQEIIAFLAALLSYGNVTAILTSLNRALTPLGETPFEKIRNNDLPPEWKNFTHRFTKGEDLVIVCHWLRCAIQSHGSLEGFFVAGEGTQMKELLSSFVQRLRSQELPPHLKKIAAKRERNLKYLISDPEQGSACKRLNMFLRWVVRENDGIDLGLWKKIKAETLILPIDTHLLQTLRRLKWTRSKQATWKVAEDATKRLRLYCADDPVRYDFSLCHLSMSRGSYAALE